MIFEINHLIHVQDELFEHELLPVLTGLSDSAAIRDKTCFPGVSKAVLGKLGQTSRLEAGAPKERVTV